MEISSRLPALTGETQRVAVRRAAALAVLVPGLGLRLHRVGAPIVRVATSGRGLHRTIEIGPAEFRRLVALMCEGDRSGLVGLVDPSCGPLELEWFTDSTAQLGPFGIVRDRRAGGAVTYAMATAIGSAKVGAVVRGVATSCGSVFGSVWANRVRVERDAAIAMTTLCVDSEPGDTESVQLAFALVAGATAVCAALELLDAAAAGHLAA